MTGNGDRAPLAPAPCRAGTLLARGQRGDRSEEAGKNLFLIRSAAFGAIGKEAKNPGGRSRQFSFMNVFVGFNAEEKKGTVCLCGLDAVLFGDLFES